MYVCMCACVYVYMCVCILLTVLAIRILLCTSLPHSPLSSSQLSVYNEPYEKTAKKGKKKKSSMTSALDPFSEKKEDHSASVQMEMDETTLLEKVDSTTRHMLLKTQFLFGETKKFMKKVFHLSLSLSLSLLFPLTSLQAPFL